MYKKCLWLYVLSTIALSESSHASDIEGDKESLPQTQTVVRTRTVDFNVAISSESRIKRAINCERQERISNVIHAKNIPAFVRDVIPVDVLIDIDFRNNYEFQDQVVNLIQSGLLIQRTDINGLSLFDKKRAIAECYFQAAQINIVKLNTTVGNFDPETTIDDLTSIGQLLLWAALKCGVNSDRQELLPLSISFFRTAESLLVKINQKKSIVYARKLIEEIAKARHYQQTLGLNQS